MDFVSWNLCPPTIQGFKEYLKQPTWLILKIWGHNKKEQANLMNELNHSSAHTALNIEAAISGFSGSKIDPDLNKYLPYPGLNEDPAILEIKQKITIKSVELYWSMRESGELHGNIESAFNRNKNLIKVLRSKRASLA